MGGSGISITADFVLAHCEAGDVGWFPVLATSPFLTRNPWPIQICVVGVVRCGRWDSGRTATTSTFWDGGSPLQNFQSGPGEHECGALSRLWSSHSTGATQQQSGGEGRLGQEGRGSPDRRSDQTHRTYKGCRFDTSVVCLGRRIATIKC